MSVCLSVHPSGNMLIKRHAYIYPYVRLAKDLVIGLSTHDQTFALRVDLKKITELSSVKKQAGAELYPKLSKKFKKVRKKCEKHQIFRKLAADSSADASADEVGRINIGRSRVPLVGCGWWV